MSSAVLATLYIDDTLIAVDKPSGMVVHRGQCNDPLTVADIVRDEIAGAPVHAIHRLDRGTSGVLLFARKAEAARELQKQMTSGTFVKKYIALVRGVMRADMRVDHAIRQRDSNDRIDAVTEFSPIKTAGRWSLVQAQPITGRTHQIRLHLKHLCMPIVGDVRYGKGDVNRLFKEQFSFSRLALHASELHFKHPETRRQVTVSSPLPPDFADVLSKLELL